MFTWRCLPSWFKVQRESKWVFIYLMKLFERSVTTALASFSCWGICSPWQHKTQIHLSLAVPLCPHVPHQRQQCSPNWDYMHHCIERDTLYFMIDKYDTMPFQLVVISWLKWEEHCHAVDKICLYTCIQNFRATLG